MSLTKEDIKLFINETEELIQKIEDQVFRLEKNPNDTKPVKELYFSFHTLKGLTAMAGLDKASEFCHHFESFLDESTRNEISIDKQEDFINLLFDSLDLLRNILKRVKNGDFTDVDDKFLTMIKESFQDFKIERELEIPLFHEIPTNQINNLLADNSNIFHKVYIRLNPTCVFKTVRLFIIGRALNEVGKIFFSKPEPSILESGDFGVDFELYYLSQKNDSDIIKILDEILEIENKVITKLKNTEVKLLFKQKSSLQAKKRTKAKTTLSKKEKLSPEKTKTVSRILDTFEDESGKITSVKVAIDVLESLMNSFSEVVITKNQISQILKEKNDQELNMLFDNMDKPFLDMQEIVFNLKLVRVESTFRKYRKLIRDVSKEVKKKVDLVLEGTNVEIDRKILEEINSPLVHLLRNAIYHGIESPQERKKKKKPESGTLKLSTLRRAGMIHIEVTDDGEGIDYDGIREKVIEKGIFSEEKVSNLSIEDLNRIILMPGFSILSDANQISGRGMGLAIVAEKIKELGGTFSIYSEKGAGTKFILKVPFTRAIINAQLIKVAGDLFAIPTDNIKEILMYEKGLVETIGNDDYYKVNSSELIPIIDLNQYLKLSEKENKESYYTKVAIWVKKDEEVSVVLVTDEILQQMDVVVKPFKFNYSDFYDILGSTIMGDGSICLILDVLSIISNNISGDKFQKLTVI